MEIKITPSASREGVLRIWIRRVPEDSNVVYAFRPGNPAQPVGQAYVYGRGAGSTASERVMLLMRLNTTPDEPQFREGETLRLMVRNPDNDSYDDITLDIMEVE